jgi:glycosyltransferase involved in cell wall biosynthesis
MPKADTPAHEPAAEHTIAVVVKGWPRLSETFIARELRGFEARGLRLRLYSLRHPTDGRVHATARALTAPVTYLPEYLRHAPLRVWRGWRAARRLPGYAAARAAWRRDLARDLTPNRIRRFGQALVLAAEMPADVAHLYAHFLHTPASVARYAALLRGLSWSASAHAKDIWTTPSWDKTEKLAEAAWVVTCTGAGHRHLQTLAPPRKVELVHHGIDGRRYTPPASRPPRDGTDPHQPVTILSVGRAVPKKGFEDLLAALARLPRDRHWRFVHIGGGPLLASLQGQAAHLGIEDRIEWRGSRDEDDVLAAYGEADLFVLASRVTSDGDRDGIPNVIVEAMGRGLPVVATTAGAIPEIVSSDSGVLVAPGNTEGFADAMAALISDPSLRQARGRAGAARVLEEFPAERGFDRIAARLRASIASARAAAAPDR